MERRAPDGVEYGDEQSFAMIADAGFDGVCLDPAAHEIDACLARQSLFEKYGLGCMINAFPESDDDLCALLDLAREMDAAAFSIIGTVYPETVEEAVPIVRRWLDICDVAGVPAMFETHRDCITNDMFFTLQLLDEIPQLRLCADLSHYVLNRELRLPITARFAELFERILERSDCFQGRIANREQIQVPIAFPQHAEWVELFRNWWQRGIRSWRARNGDNAELVFLCELGPPQYAITDADGHELSDRWQEALTIKSWVEEIWAATES
ncbi:MAG: hypothetical protein R3358_13480 [Woeseiaceae bacterium]|nr:hypothetical protein [Woeseiaceae bacterium]